MLGTTREGLKTPRNVLPTVATGHGEQQKGRINCKHQFVIMALTLVYLGLVSQRVSDLAST